MKQFFAPLAAPLGITWLFMALAVLWLLWRRQWRSALWLGVPTVVLFMVGSTPLAEALVAREESRYALGAEHSGRRTEETGPVGGAGVTPTGIPADAVVALGGRDSISRCDLLGFAARDGVSRMLTAVELVRLGKAKTLVLGGSMRPLPGKPGVPGMAVVQDWVTSWRVSDAAVTNLGFCLNTHDEAIAFRKLKENQGWKKVLLVTSALHMRRSEALFRKQGIDVVPVAADFEAYGVPPESGFSPFPREHRFVLLSRYLHEKIGCWVYRWRGWI